jgi:hypothetical protein
MLGGTAVNMFSVLSAYGLSSPENYLTEALVYVLTMMLRRTPRATLEILNRLAPSLPKHPFSAPADIAIRTQLETPAGRPDICITQGTDTLVYVEIKHDSPLEPGQLEAYLGELDRSGRPNHALVFLSRSKGDSSITTLAESQFTHACWYNLHDWLLLSTRSEPVCSFLVDELLAYLQEKAMDLPHVDWEYQDGVPALLHLTGMMEAAYKEVLPKGQIRRSGGWFARGFYVDNAYFFGIRYAEPMLIVFENNFGTSPSAKATLDIRGTHFLALNHGEQFEALIAFVKESLTSVPKGTVTTAPPDAAA